MNNLEENKKRNEEKLYMIHQLNHEEAPTLSVQEIFRYTKMNKYAYRCKSCHTQPWKSSLNPKVKWHETTRHVSYPKFILICMQCIDYGKLCHPHDEVMAGPWAEFYGFASESKLSEVKKITANLCNNVYCFEYIKD